MRTAGEAGAAAGGWVPPAWAASPARLRALLASRGDGAALHADAAVDAWLDRQAARRSLEARLVPLDGLPGWVRDPATGWLCHESGRFFSVLGVSCRHRVARAELAWDQPIIEQPETGILGLLARSFGGVLHLCLQAKEEPGNLGGVQLSPAVQATFSNYTGVHGGAAPRYLEHFLAPPPERVLYARLQTEDGGRFLYKSNRNMVVDVGEAVPAELPDGYIWLTLRQLAALLRRDDLVNACARSILSALLLPPGGPEAAPAAPAGIWDTLQWLDDRRAANHMVARRIGLGALREWAFDGRGAFSHRGGRFFRVVGVEVSAAGREVGAWSQPILANAAPGIIGLLVRDGPRGRELLMQAKAEVGNRSTVQLGPTVQFTQENYASGSGLERPFLAEAFLDPGRLHVVHESRQSEEGARFYREHHLHRVLALPEGEDPALPPDHRWLPLSHVQFLVQLGEQVNSCARSALACLL